MLLIEKGGPDKKRRARHAILSSKGRAGATLPGLGRASIHGGRNLPSVRNLKTFGGTSDNGYTAPQCTTPPLAKLRFSTSLIFCNLVCAFNPPGPQVRLCPCVQAAGPHTGHSTVEPRPNNMGHTKVRFLGTCHGPWVRITDVCAP